MLFGRGVDRLGKGIRGTPRDVLLVDDIPPHARGRAFGLHRAADTAGAVVGPLLGLGLYEAFDHRIRPLLYIALVPATLSVIAVFFARDRARDVQPRLHAQSVEASGAALPHAVRRVIVFLALFSLVNFPDALLILRAKELGLSLSSVILAYCLYNVSYAGLSLPAGAPRGSHNTESCVRDRAQSASPSRISALVSRPTARGSGRCSSSTAAFRRPPMASARRGSVV